MNFGIIMLADFNLVALGGFFSRLFCLLLGESLRTIKVKMATFYMQGKRGQSALKTSCPVKQKIVSCFIPMSMFKN